jgi:hypothetical protein
MIAGLLITTIYCTAVWLVRNVVDGVLIVQSCVLGGSVAALDIGSLSIILPGLKALWQGAYDLTIVRIGHERSWLR